MAGGKDEFERQLREMGYEPEPRPDGRTVFAYQIQTGRLAGTAIRLGFVVPPDFSRTPPSGPHVSPQLLPLNPGAPTHPTRVHASDFGSEWQYWSRPYPAWNPRNTAATYLAYMEHLFGTI